MRRYIRIIPTSLLSIYSFRSPRADKLMYTAMPADVIGICRKPCLLHSAVACEGMTVAGPGRCKNRQNCWTGPCLLTKHSTFEVPVRVKILSERAAKSSSWMFVSLTAELNIPPPRVDNDSCRVLTFDNDDRYCFFFLLISFESRLNRAYYK